jgi:hypothetical protein
MRYFDYQAVALQAAIAPRELARLRRAVKREFPGDVMLQELHLLRVCSAIRDGQLEVKQAVAGARG